MIYDKKLKLYCVAPFNLKFTAWALRRRQKNEIDRWKNNTYSRVIFDDGRLFKLLITQNSRDCIDVVVKSSSDIKEEIIIYNLRKLLGLDINLEDFYDLATRDNNLSTLCERFMGLKPPRFPSIFEALVNSITCQQISLDAGISILNKLAKKYGHAFNDLGIIQYSFPDPYVLSEADENDLRGLGYSYPKARYIIGLSKTVSHNKDFFLQLEGLANEEIVKKLCSFKGIGRWSSEYCLLRGFGRIDIFPGDDVGAQKNLMLLLDLDRKLNYEMIKEITNKWSPFAGFVYFHLLLNKLSQKGFL